MKTEVLTLGIFLLISISSCVESFTGEVPPSVDNVIEEILVVEATLTDEVKQQRLRLRFGQPFGSGEVSGINTALVLIESDEGNIFNFLHRSDGLYVSNEVFGAVANEQYRLVIQLNGKEYVSSFEKLPTTAMIEEIYAERMTNDLGTDGVGIFIDILGEGEIPYYRYEFEETYKIIAPRWTPFDLEVSGVVPPFEFDLVAREQEEQICFGTQFSNRIIQSTGLGVNNNAIRRFMVNFVAKENPILIHRYSIQVSQLSQSANAYSFYESLRKQSSSDNLFSDIQPGFVSGNISGAEADEMVLGIFEVASVSKKRLFFNFEDVFEGEEFPPYFVRCRQLLAPDEFNPGFFSPLKNALDTGNFVYAGPNFGEVPGGGPYLLVRRECGDCTALGSNMVPDFWEE